MNGRIGLQVDLLITKTKFPGKSSYSPVAELLKYTPLKEIIFNRLFSNGIVYSFNNLATIEQTTLTTHNFLYEWQNIHGVNAFFSFTYQIY